MSAPAESVPVLCSDGGEAASVWRFDKLKGFDWKLRCLGLDQDPVFAELLSKINEHTAALEQLWERQKQPDYVRPWWADGHYDCGRADSANDEGLRQLLAGRLSDAFDCFTEAIRLYPSSPVYHCNRAAVCLRLGRPDLAAEDAGHAIERDSQYLRAHLRGGRAHLQLRQPAQARQLFQKALILDPDHTAATGGLIEAEAMLRQQEEQQQGDENAAQLGSRPGITRMAVPEAEAAEQLYAAEQMLAANPTLQSARCAHIEGLILCQRYQEADMECKELMEGVDKLYLQAEAAWRLGNLEGAAASLNKALGLAPSCLKCIQLRTFVLELVDVWREAALAMEDAELSRCVERSMALLVAVQPPACLGLYCAVQHMLAEANAMRGLWGEALRSLNAALEMDGNHAKCLQLRAEVHKHMGANLEAVLDLQRLQKVAPGTPGLFATLEEVARLCLEGQLQDRGRRAVGCGGGSGCGFSADALEVLGLTPTATAAQVRQAYLKQAAKWHPDKWVGASDGEKETVENKFKEVQKAYEVLR